MKSVRNIMVTEKKSAVPGKSMEKERCVLCQCELEIPVGLHVAERENYVSGAGQLCGKCWRKLYGSREL